MKCSALSIASPLRDHLRREGGTVYKSQRQVMTPAVFLDPHKTKTHKTLAWKRRHEHETALQLRSLLEVYGSGGGRVGFLQGSDS